MNPDITRYVSTLPDQAVMDFLEAAQHEVARRGLEVGHVMMAGANIVGNEPQPEAAPVTYKELSDKVNEQAATLFTTERAVMPDAQFEINRTIWATLGMQVPDLTLEQQKLISDNLMQDTRNRLMLVPMMSPQNRIILADRARMLPGNGLAPKDGDNPHVLQFEDASGMDRVYQRLAANTGAAVRTVGGDELALGYSTPIGEETFVLPRQRYLQALRKVDHEGNQIPNEVPEVLIGPDDTRWVAVMLSLSPEHEQQGIAKTMHEHTGIMQTLDTLLALQIFGQAAGRPFEGIYLAQEAIFKVEDVTGSDGAVIGKEPADDPEAYVTLQLADGVIYAGTATPTAAGVKIIPNMESALYSVKPEATQNA